MIVANFGSAINAMLPSGANDWLHAMPPPIDEGFYAPLPQPTACDTYRAMTTDPYVCNPGSTCSAWNPPPAAKVAAAKAACERSGSLPGINPFAFDESMASANCANAGGKWSTASLTCSYTATPGTGPGFTAMSQLRPPSFWDANKKLIGLVFEGVVGSTAAGLAVGGISGSKKAGVAAGGIALAGFTAWLVVASMGYRG